MFLKQKYPSHSCFGDPLFKTTDWMHWEELQLKSVEKIEKEKPNSDSLKDVSPIIHDAIRDLYNLYRNCNHPVDFSVLERELHKSDGKISAILEKLTSLHHKVDHLGNAMDRMNEKMVNFDSSVSGGLNMILSRMAGAGAQLAGIICIICI